MICRIALFLFVTLPLWSGTTATRTPTYPTFQVGGQGRLLITTSPVLASQPVYRWRQKNGAPDGVQPTEIGITDALGKLDVFIDVIPADSVGTYSNEQFTVGSPTAAKSAALNYVVNASTPPTVSRPNPYPTYLVGQTATLSLTTNPVQANQPVYRWRLRDGSPDGSQPQLMGNTDSLGNFTLSETWSQTAVGSYTGETYSVGTTTGPKSTARSFTVNPAPAAPSVTRAAPYPNYRVGDTTSLSLTTNPVQANQTIYRWRKKNGAWESSGVSAGTTDATGRFNQSLSVTEALIGTYTDEQFSVGSTTNPKSIALAYIVEPALRAPVATRSAPYPNYRVGDTSTLTITTNPVQANQTIFRWRKKNGAWESNGTSMGNTDATGRYVATINVTEALLGSYTDEQFAVGNLSGLRSTSLAYTVSPALPAPIATRSTPYPNYRVGDTSTLTITTNPAQPNQPIFRWRKKNGVMESNGADVGVTDALGKYVATINVTDALLGTYTEEQFAVGSLTGTRSASLAYTVSPALRAPIATRSAPYPNYRVGDTSTLTISTDPAQPNQPIFRWRKKDGAWESNGVEFAMTDASGRYTATINVTDSLIGSYTDEQFAVGSLTGLRSTSLAYTVQVAVSAPLVSRSHPYPYYRVGGTSALSLTTSPVQANQPVYAWRLKDGAINQAGVQVGTTDAQGTWTQTRTWTSTDMAHYTQEQFAVGNTGNPRSQALDYYVSTNANIDITNIDERDLNGKQTNVVRLTGTGLRPDQAVRLKPQNSSLAAPPTPTIISVAPDGTWMDVEIPTSSTSDYFNLIVTDQAAERGEVLQIIGQEPVIKGYSPAFPSKGGTYMFQIYGHSLEGATLTFPEGMTFTPLNTQTATESISGLLDISSNAEGGLMRLRTPYGEVTAPIIPIAASSKAPLKEFNLLSSDGITPSTYEKPTGGRAPLPELLFQELSPVQPNPEFGKAPNTQANKEWGCSFNARVSWANGFGYVTPVAINLDTNMIGQIQTIMGLGDVTQLGAFALAVVVEIMVSAEFSYDCDRGWVGPSLCYSFKTTVQIPGAHANWTSSGCFYGVGGSTFTSALSYSSPFINDGQCINTTNYGISQGIAYADVAMAECCSAPITLDMQVFNSSGFRLANWDNVPIGNVEPDPACGGSATCASISQAKIVPEVFSGHFVEKDRAEPIRFTYQYTSTAGPLNSSLVSWTASHGTLSTRQGTVVEWTPPPGFVSTALNDVVLTATCGVAAVTYPLTVIEATIKDGSIPSNELIVDLKPAGVTGDLEVWAQNATNTAIHTVTNRASGTDLKIPLKRVDIPTGEYTGFGVTWKPEGAQAKGTKTYAFEALGDYRHTQYNIPAEENCPGGTISTYNTTREPDTGYINCDDPTLMIKMGSDFRVVLDRNGSGDSRFLTGNEKKLQIEGLCEASYRRNSKQLPSTGTRYGTLDNTAVAIRPSHGKINLGDKLFIDDPNETSSNKGYIKTAIDNGGGLNTAQLDHFNADIKLCNGIPDISPNLKTFVIP